MDTGGPMDGLTADQCHGYASRSDGSLVRSAPRKMTASSVLASCHKKFVGFLRWVLPARRERPCRSRAAERDQQFPSSDGDCHTPLPCEVRKGKDTTPRACR